MGQERGQVPIPTGQQAALEMICTCLSRPESVLVCCLLALALFFPLFLSPCWCWGLLGACFWARLWFQRQRGRLCKRSWCSSTWGENTVIVTVCLYSFCPSRQHGDAEQSQLLITLWFLLSSVSLSIAINSCELSSQRPCSTQSSAERKLRYRISFSWVALRSQYKLQD